jgi:hypothetical protein
VREDDDAGTRPCLLEPLDHVTAGHVRKSPEMTATGEQERPPVPR